MNESSILCLSNKRLVIDSYFDQSFTDYDMPYHLHNTFEVYFVESGKCRFSLFYPESGRHIHVKLKTGDFIFVDANVFHRLTVSGENPCHLLELEIKALDLVPGAVDPGIALRACDGLRSALGKSDHIHLLENDVLRPNLKRIIALLNSDRRYVDHPFTQTLLNELLFNIDQSYSFYYLDNHYVRRTIDFIMSNYNEDITLEQIAAGVKLNVSYLQKIFRGATGMTVWSFLKKYRIERAISLIKNTQMNFIEIAFEVGFSNRQTFFNVFKDIMGVTPSQYKKYLSSPQVVYSGKDHRAEVTIDDRLKRSD